LIEKLDAIHEVAMQEAALPSAINAVKAQAQLLGYMDQTVTINHNVRPSELSLEDLRRMVSKELEASPQPALLMIEDAEFKEIEDE
jgi:type II secretory pathway predicted ATPase ExeA